MKQSKTHKHYSLKSVKWVNNVVGNNLNCFSCAMYDNRVTALLLLLLLQKT